MCCSKNDVSARITEPTNDDYDNGVSDNCDHNFGTFDDFGVKNDQKVSNNMILMSKYKGKHCGKKGQKIWARPSPLSPAIHNFQFRTDLGIRTLPSLGLAGNCISKSWTKENQWDINDNESWLPWSSLPPCVDLVRGRI